MTDPLVHPHELLTAPDGQQANIDARMVPIIRALWTLGYKTTACCQDVGEATKAVRDQKDTGAYKGEDFIAYYTGWALLKMPWSDALRFIGMVAEFPALSRYIERRWQAESWRMQVPLIHEKGATAPDRDALIHFPARHIALLSQVLAAHVRALPAQPHSLVSRPHDRSRS
ncbi:hypothetical protein OG345_41740 (plasmid) [Streptomyces sp. NBC_01220]|uniref:hypothetical protein n=1 Tax=Streptomyces sp. NBC_01220 TaxID=2903781 RepID=UPI00352D2C9B|nr:hypothetical protein OG345_41740 [Streptomyces sp. NBC_01220]